MAKSGLLGSKKAAEENERGVVATYACQLEDFGSQILEDSGHIHGGLGADTHLVLGVGLEETLDTTAGELESGDVSIREATE